MKHQTKLSLGKLIVAAAAVTSLDASATYIGNTGSFSQDRVAGYFQANGGEFRASSLVGLHNNAYHTGASDLESTRDIGAKDPSFQTFCLELSETASANNYFVVGSAATRGSEAVNDPLSRGTTWLYSQFAGGSLNVIGGDYFDLGGPSRDNEAALLQKAIWALENEQSNPAAGTNPYFDAAVAHFGSIAGAEADAAVGENRVYVLINFTTAAARDAFVASGTIDAATKAQDFLWYVPDTGATLMLMGMGLMGLGLVRRRIA